uniref:Uncharacterized protein n=1 Tax=Arundo donax TaxID=35708 RepID=A0A0A9EPG9_ARUDO
MSNCSPPSRGETRSKFMMVHTYIILK